MVFENKVLRRIFGTKTDSVTGEWSRLHNEELCDLYSPPNVIQVISSRRMRWVGQWHIWGQERCIHGFGGET
jgi:hypothetical protein